MCTSHHKCMVIMVIAQVICVGDFLQLPAVGSRPLIYKDIWREGNFATIILTQIFRQLNIEYAMLLASMRLGQFPREKAERFLELVNVVDGVHA